MNRLIGKLTGRDKLLGQLNQLSKKMNELDIERNRIRSELNKAAEERAVANNVIINLKKSRSEFEEKYKKLNQAFHNKTQEMEKLSKKYVVLSSTNSELTNEVTALREETKAANFRLHDLEQEMSFYESRFGRMLESPESVNSVHATDWDCNFFEVIEKIKGNPFNENQVEAIRYDMEKHLQIIAGAGSGKTETICAKVAYLIQMKKVNPNRICMMTFTRKAKEEMEGRVNLFLGVDNSRVNVSTFHGTFMSLFNQLKRQNPAYASIGIQGGNADEGEFEYKKELRKLINKHSLFKFDKYNEKTIFERVSFWTNMGFSRGQMTEYIEKHFDSVIDDKEDIPVSVRFNLMLDELNQTRKDKKIVVYDDFLINLYNALLQYPEARDFVQDRYDYIFIDEFQDINPLQMETVKLICPPASTSKLIIVGDDDQSIYMFRGSEPSYIKDFPKTYNTHEIRLMRNYRSKPNIVKAGNWVISYNEHDRIKKSMESFHKDDGDAVIVACSDTKEEAHWILTRSQEIGKLEPFELEGIVEPINYTKSTVLYRSRRQLQSMFQALDVRGVPYVIEKMDDVMGIFSIQDFHNIFKMWQELVASQGNKLQLWRSILTNALGHYFVNKNAIVHWYENLDVTTFSDVIQEALSLVVAKTRNKEKDTVPLKQYLSLLVDLKQDKPVNMKAVAEYFLDFPRVKENVTDEEKDWIFNELEKYNAWTELFGFYERMLKRKEEMKGNLEKYHDEKYNALYFLTIHGSKGLAFENVFVIGCNDGGLPSSHAVELKFVDVQSCREKAEPPTTEEEERRLMYVAVTRAQKKLYVTFPKTIQDKPCGRSKFLGELNLQILDCNNVNPICPTK
ncbi:UvrD-helicase domain-containing protein [Paenibacillus endoradicis]|uniref:UvrD-helicase domain-containing protein n=1 Tax=Paenibacillus endoradicis TaxID=2972487 RepID=UPI0021599C9C|nr:UvrD-helicase domain-containing protein [Paenibacillus endoradicis]MCR8659178.1 UvrD-helicase domain-containing protein [Paenibacillus endoradicis]